MNEENKDEVKKSIDESRKESVFGDNPGPPANDIPEVPEVTFGLFMSGLLMEALIALGDVEHPITKKKELSVPHAKFIIETLNMLKDKTKNNLAKDEESSLEGILYDLRLRFVNKAGK